MVRPAGAPGISTLPNLVLQVPRSACREGGQGCPRAFTLPGSLSLSSNSGRAEASGGENTCPRPHGGDGQVTTP